VDKQHKISDLLEDRLITRNVRDENGYIQRVEEWHRYKVPIKELSSGLRFVNFIVDTTIVSIVIYVFIFDSFGIYLLSLLIYYLFSELLFQRTIGKFFTKSIVINEYCEKPDFGSIILRTLIRFVPFEIFSFLMSNRGWHDIWTKTYVIKVSRLKKLKELMNDPENFKSAPVIQGRP